MNASPAAPYTPAFDLSSLPSTLISQPPGLRSQQPSRPDPVRYRVHAGQQRTHYEAMQPVATQAPTRTLHLLAETRGAGPRRPHPGDILYWVACLGGACLLILCATM